MESSESGQKNITDKWLDNIFESLMRLQGYERMLKEGCGSVLEYVQNPEINLADIQYKNYTLFMTEVEIILGDTRHLIDKQKFLNLSILFKVIKEIENEAEGFIYTQYDMVNHTEWRELKPDFELVKPKVSQIRSMLVSALWKLLSPSARENMGGLPE